MQSGPMRQPRMHAAFDGGLQATEPQASMSMALNMPVCVDGWHAEGRDILYGWVPPVDYVRPDVCHTAQMEGWREVSALHE